MRTFFAARPKDAANPKKLVPTFPPYRLPAISIAPEVTWRRTEVSANGLRGLR
jgi:hypothetical protein